MLNILNVNRSTSDMTNNLSKNISKHSFNESINVRNIFNIEHQMMSKRLDEQVSAEPASTTLPNQRAHFQSFLQKYPSFLRNYCMCLHRRIDPDDTNEPSITVGNKCISEEQNQTPIIIPITVDPKTYVLTH